MNRPKDLGAVSVAIVLYGDATYIGYAFVGTLDSTLGDLTNPWYMDLALALLVLLILHHIVIRNTERDQK